MAESNKLAYVDAIRGIAILAVLLVHVAGLVRPGGLVEEVANQGARGVQLFYLASAFTLLMSHSRRSQVELNPVRNFYIRRFFRIAPAFYLAIIGYTLFYGFEPRFWAPEGIGWGTVASTAAFVNGWHPETINSVVPGGWSIAVEVMFYLVFPLLFVHVNSIRRAVWALLGSSAFALGLNWIVKRFITGAFPENLLKWFFELWLPAQLPVFFVGFAVYYILKSTNVTRQTALLLIAGSMYLAGGLVLGAYTFLPHHVLYGIVFGLFFVGLATYPMRVFVNGFTVLTGKLSFSMYLCHFAVLEALRGSGVFASKGGPAWFAIAYLATVAGTMVVSHLVYSAVESPMIRLGSRLITRLEQRSRAAEVVGMAA